MGKGAKNTVDDMTTSHSNKDSPAPASASKSSSPPVYVVGIACMWVGYILSCVMSSTGFAPFAHEAQVSNLSSPGRRSLLCPARPGRHARVWLVGWGRVCLRHLARVFHSKLARETKSSSLSGGRSAAVSRCPVVNSTPRSASAPQPLTPTTLFLHAPPFLDHPLASAARHAAVWFPVPDPCPSTALTIDPPGCWRGCHQRPPVQDLAA